MANEHRITLRLDEKVFQKLQRSGAVDNLSAGRYAKKVLAGSYERKPRMTADNQKEELRLVYNLANNMNQLARALNQKTGNLSEATAERLVGQFERAESEFKALKKQVQEWQ